MNLGLTLYGLWTTSSQERYRPPLLFSLCKEIELTEAQQPASLQPARAPCENIL